MICSKVVGLKSGGLLCVIGIWRGHNSGFTARKDVVIDYFVIKKRSQTKRIIGIC